MENQNGFSGCGYVVLSVFVLAFSAALASEIVPPIGATGIILFIVVWGILLVFLLFVLTYLFIVK